MNFKSFLSNDYFTSLTNKIFSKDPANSRILTNRDFVVCGTCRKDFSLDHFSKFIQVCKYIFALYDNF